MIFASFVPDLLLTILTVNRSQAFLPCPYFLEDEVDVSKQLLIILFRRTEGPDRTVATNEITCGD